MSVVGGADGHGVNLRIGKELFRGRIDLSAIFGCHLLGPMDAWIEEADESGILIGGIFRDVTNLRNFSTADNTDFQHNSTSSINQFAVKSIIFIHVTIIAIVPFSCQTSLGSTWIFSTYYKI